MTDIRKFDPQLLLVFEALLETNSASETAARLGLSQSAVSGALKRLRTAFDDPLFERHSRGLIPTARAAALTDPLVNTLAAIRNLAALPQFDPKTAHGTVTVLATDYAHAALIAPIRRQLSQEAPNLNWALQTYSSEGRPLMSQVMNIDFLIGTPAMLPDTLKARKLHEDTLGLFMGPAHALHDRKIELRDLAGFPHVLVNLWGRSRRGRIDDQLAEVGLERRVDTVTPSFLTLPSLLIGTPRLAIAPMGLASSFRGALTVRELPVAQPTVDLFLAWHNRFSHDGRHTWLRQRISQLAKA